MQTLQSNNKERKPNQMNSTTGTRKLAAVMFADIEGYTALFQRNEPAAMKQVGDHRKDLEDVTHQYNGQIIQFYGDGSATVFDSVLDAIYCAMELQELSAIDRIPLRIGIHMGDLLFKDNDIFGDVVNVASRIQSSGIPGSILISKKVADELDNHPDVHIKRIGLYTLKNVKEKIELFAVNEPGLTVPPEIHDHHLTLPKKTPYLLIIFGILATTAYFFIKQNGKKDIPFSGDGPVFIAPLKDLTNQPRFATLGEEISTSISYALGKTTSPDNIIRFESAMLYFKGDLSSITDDPKLAVRMGAKVVVEGIYDLTGIRKDSLLISARITNPQTKTVIYNFPDVKCSAENESDCIAQLRGYILGYWSSKDAHVFSFTNDKAWKAYYRARKIWADPDQTEEAKTYLLQAIAFDTTFLDAYFLLLDEQNNANQYTNEADTIELIKQRFTDLDGRQENYLRYYEEDLKGRNSEAFKYFIKEYTLDPKDLFINTTGMVLAVEYLNDPVTALKFYSEIGADTLDLNACVYCRSRASLALQASIDIADLTTAGKIARQLRPYASLPSQISRLINYHVVTGDTTAIQELISKSAKTSSTWDIQQFYLRIAAQYALVHTKNELSHYYSKKAIALYGNKVNWKVGRCHKMLGNLAMAEKIYQAETKKYPQDPWLKGELGVIYALQQKINLANTLISELESMKTEYGYGVVPYQQGKIKANLGEKAAALKYLSNALDEGMKFQTGNTFQHDPDLIVLHKDADYQKLIARNRQL